jgi:hypothetical protein
MFRILKGRIRFYILRRKIAKMDKRWEQISKLIDATFTDRDNSKINSSIQHVYARLYGKTYTQEFWDAVTPFIQCDDIYEKSDN